MSKIKRADYDKAYEDYKRGQSLNDIADTLVVSRQCVYSAFKRRGFALRSKNKTETPITIDSLLKRNFYNFEIKGRTGYIRNLAKGTDLLIEIDNTVELFSVKNSFALTIQNCNTIEDVDHIIRIFSNHGKEKE